MSDYLMHHGVLGQKWGIRRFQNADGSLTSAGKSHYRTDRALGTIGRAMTNASLGQRLLGVGVNRGYLKDRSEIKKEYKNLKQDIKNTEGLTKEERKAAFKGLKEDYKKTKGEARVAAAEALYPWQSKSTNEKIQTQNLGKQFAKSLLTSGYGALNYDRMTANNSKRGESAVVAFLSGAADYSLSGLVSIGDYAFNKVNYSQKQNKRKNTIMVDPVPPWKEK